MKDLYNTITTIEARLQDLLTLDIVELRTRMVEMFKAVSSDENERRKERIRMVYLLERLQDLEKDQDPPFGRREFQQLIDEALKVLDQDIRNLKKYQGEDGMEERYLLDEVFTAEASLDGLTPKHGKRHQTSQDAPNTKEGGDIIVHSGPVTVLGG